MIRLVRGVRSDSGSRAGLNRGTWCRRCWGGWRGDSWDARGPAGIGAGRRVRILGSRVRAVRPRGVVGRNWRVIDRGGQLLRTATVRALRTGPRRWTLIRSILCRRPC